MCMFIKLQNKFELSVSSYFIKSGSIANHMWQQECIPVGCLLPAAMPPLRPVYTYHLRLRVRQCLHQILSLCQWKRTVWTEWVQNPFWPSSYTQWKFNGDIGGQGDRDGMCKQALGVQGGFCQRHCLPLDRESPPRQRLPQEGTWDQALRNPPPPRRNMGPRSQAESDIIQRPTTTLWTDKHEWKQYLHATSFAGSRNHHIYFESTT